MAALARTRLSDEDLFQMRPRTRFAVAALSRQDDGRNQLARFEKSFLDRKVYEHFRLPRLSFFYMA